MNLKIKILGEIQEYLANIPEIIIDIRMYISQTLLGRIENSLDNFNVKNEVKR